MKKNPEMVHQLLERALKELPYDNDMSSVRFHIHRAINEISKISKKAVKAEQTTSSPWSQWKLDLTTGSLVRMTPGQTKSALGAIESLIAQEQAKIKPKQPPSNEKEVGGLFTD